METIRKVLALAILSLFFIPAAAAPIQDKKPVHTAGCPAKCDICKKSIEGALKYLVSRQEKSGSIPAIMKKNEFSVLLKNSANVMTSALAGLALFAGGNSEKEGPYSDNVKKLNEHLVAIIKDKLTKKKIEGDTWPAALCAIYFAHLHEKDKKDEKIKETLDILVKFLVKQQTKKGGWSLGYSKSFFTESPDLTAAVNLVIIALAKAKSAGVEIDDAVFEKSRKYYAKVANKKGFFNYKIEQDNGEPNQGRSIVSLFDLILLGMDKEEKYKKSFELGRKNLKSAASHHVPHLHLLLSGLTFFSLGKDDWNNFIGHYYEGIIKNQAKEGNIHQIIKFDKKIMMQSVTDHIFGDTYATACFALLLQIPDGKIRLNCPVVAKK